MKKLTVKEWNEVLLKMENFDIVFVQNYNPFNFLGNIIQLGGNGDNLDPSHTFFCGVLPTTYEADGVAVRQHGINEYKFKVIDGKQRLVVFRLKNLTNADTDKIHTFLKEIVDVPYDMGATVGDGLGILLSRIPVLGFFLGKIPNVLNNKKRLNCSQSVRKIIDKLNKYPNFDTVPAGKETPESLAERIYEIADFVVDTKK